MGMGTTLVACLLWKNKAFFANVGDSRAYLFRYPHLWRITEDHSILNMQMKKGLIKEEKAALFSESNVITRSIGFISEVEVDLFQKIWFRMTSSFSVLTASMKYRIRSYAISLKNIPMICWSKKSFKQLLMQEEMTIFPPLLSLPDEIY